MTQRKFCECDEPQFAKLHPVAMTDEGGRLLRNNDELIGLCFCYHCGGEPEYEPTSPDHVTGETVVRRLVELGVAKS